MASTKQSKIAVIILNWNGKEDSLICIDAVLKQTQPNTIIAIDNGSTDDFVKSISTRKDLVLLKNDKNLGFSGGVNTGIKYAIKNNYDYVALINNDAKPTSRWLEELVSVVQSNTNVGIVTGKLLKTDGTIDSTGDQYTTWGLAYPRGRDDKDSKKYNSTEFVFGATGGASLYRIEMLKGIGLFDEDFFAYYEDVDLSFRAQLAGWLVAYTPRAVAYHKIGASSSKIPGFTTYMTIKNLPLLFTKNVPGRMILIIGPRFLIAYIFIILSSISKGTFTPVIKGMLNSLFLIPKKLFERHKIQSSKVVSDDYIKSIIIFDLPPNTRKLQKVREILKTIRFWN